MWKLRKSSTAEQKDFNADPRCVWCSHPLGSGEYTLPLRNGDFQPLYVCENNFCERYGLLSLYKLIGTGTDD